METQKVYFPNLNGLRFIAAMMVLFPHIEQIKSLKHLGNNLSMYPIGLGKLGVILFFVLSGFLITYLLLTEEYFFKKINIKEFYMRRLLRIWPLYFLIIILAFLVLPNIELFTLPGYDKEQIYTNLSLKLLLYVILFPNLALSLFGIVPYASHTWSIGTEEQFYLVWPVILKYFKKHRMIIMLIVFFFSFSVEKIISIHFYDVSSSMALLSRFLSTFKIDCMAIGGLFAIILFQKKNMLKLLQNNILFYSTIFLVIFLILNRIIIPYIHLELYAVLFGLIILNFASNKEIKISLENKYLSYLGTISYGIYMYHPIGIVLALALASTFNLMTNWLIYPLSLLLTFILAIISYKYCETFFLKFKKKHSKIVSGHESIEKS